MICILCFLVRIGVDIMFIVWSNGVSSLVRVVEVRVLMFMLVIGLVYFS